jgi:hypothetical protein
VPEGRAPQSLADGRRCLKRWPAQLESGRHARVSGPTADALCRGCSAGLNRSLKLGQAMCQGMKRAAGSSATKQVGSRTCACHTHTPHLRVELVQGLHAHGQPRSQLVGLHAWRRLAGGWAAVSMVTGRQPHSCIARPCHNDTKSWLRTRQRGERGHGANDGLHGRRRRAQRRQRRRGRALACRAGHVAVTAIRLRAGRAARGMARGQSWDDWGGGGRRRLGRCGKAHRRRAGVSPSSRYTPVTRHLPSTSQQQE